MTMMLTFSIAQTVADGGFGVLSIITLMLILMFIAIWKAPDWVKEIGLITLVISILLPLTGWIKTLGVALTVNGVISSAVLAAGFRKSAIALAYGLIVYLISLVSRMLMKSKGKSRH